MIRGNLKVHVVATGDQTGDGVELNIMGAYLDAEKAQRLAEEYNEKKEVQDDNYKGLMDIYLVEVE